MLWSEEHDQEEQRLLKEEPIALFGENEKRAKIVYRRLVKMFHPDTIDAPHNYRATIAFEKLQAKWEAYCKPQTNAPATDGNITISGKAYILKGILSESGQLKLFRINETTDYILAVARTTGINLTPIKAKVCKQLFPEIVLQNLKIPQKDGSHSAALFNYPKEEMRSLATVPQRIVPKDIAWIWRRIVSVAAANTDEKRCYSFDPALEFIMPETHGYLSFSGIVPKAAGSYLKAAAKLMLTLMEPNAPIKIIRHFKAIETCSDTTHPAQILIDFDSVICAEWGERRFHKFKYPKEW